MRSGQATSSFKEAGYRMLERAVGRRNVVRLGRFLSNRARLDVQNDMNSNGELLVLDIMVSSRPPGKEFVAVDVGANVGEWTNALLFRLQAKALPSRLFAFEPVSSTRAILEKTLLSTGGHSSVEVVASALSEEVSVSPMFIVGDGAGRNSLHSGCAISSRIEEVRTDTLDEFCRRASINHIDIVKIDTEGHDVAVLMGARGMLERSAVDLIQFEYNHCWVYSRRYLRDAFSLLLPLGYRLGKVTPFGIEFYTEWHPELETFREGNYIACSLGQSELFPTIRWWNDG